MNTRPPTTVFLVGIRHASWDVGRSRHSHDSVALRRMGPLRLAARGSYFRLSPRITSRCHPAVLALACLPVYPSALLARGLRTLVSFRSHDHLCWMKKHLGIVRKQTSPGRISAATWLPPCPRRPASFSAKTHPRCPIHLCRQSASITLLCRMHTTNTDRL